MFGMPHSGPDFYGFSNPTIMMLLQEMHGMDSVSNFNYQDFSSGLPKFRVSVPLM